MSPIRSEGRRAEIAWFSALCSDDYEFLGVPDPSLRSSFDHCGEIVRLADRLGYDNILLPSSYQVGQDPLTFAGGVAPQLERLALLVAIRCGEVHPPMLARALSTLDHMLEGRLTVNIISSDLPGEVVDSAARYRRSSEVIQILKQAWSEERISIDGEFYQLELDSTDPIKPYQQNGGPLLYFGGYSPPARALCAEHCDVYLMWPDTEEGLAAGIKDLSQQAEAHDRVLDYGLRIHVVVRKTEAEARDAANRLMSRLDAELGQEIKGRAQDSASAGVRRQDELRDQSDDDYIEPNVWSGIGRARSGCASALVGSPDQIYDKIQRYMDLGFRAFIFSGYPHLDECRYFADSVLPRLDQVSLPVAQGRRPHQEPETPLTYGERR